MDIFERLRIAKEKLAAETPATNYQQSYVRDTTPVAEPPKLPPGPAFGAQSAPASLRPLRAPQTLTAPSAATVLKPHPQPAATPMPARKTTCEPKAAKPLCTQANTTSPPR